MKVKFMWYVFLTLAQLTYFFFDLSNETITRIQYTAQGRYYRILPSRFFDKNSVKSAFFIVADKS